MNNKTSIIIKKLSLEFDKIAIPILSTYNLTPSQYKIIKYLLINEDKDIRQKDIEKEFSMTNPTVTRIINNLEKNNWIKRVENNNDKRSKLLKLTKSSLNKKEELYDIGLKLENKFIKGLNKDEQKELNRLLNKLFNSIKEE